MHKGGLQRPGIAEGALALGLGVHGASRAPRVRKTFQNGTSGTLR